MTLPAQITTNLFSDFKNSFIGPFPSVSQVAQDTHDSGETFGTTGEPKLAQSFQVTTAGELVNVDVYLTKQGSPTDNVTVSLRADNAGVPGTELARGTNIAASSITASKYYRSTFFLPASLSTSTPYWILLYRTGAEDATNKYIWQKQSTAPYANGQIKLGNTAETTWSDRTGDLRFKANVRLSGRYQPGVDKTNNKIRMFKSTDGGNTWSEQDSANAPSIFSTANFKSITAAMEDTFIAVMRPGDASTYSTFRFNVATDTWETSSWGGNSGHTMNTNVTGVAPLLLAYRPTSSNKFAAAFNGPTETVMGNPRRRVKVKRTATSSGGYDIVGSPNTPDTTTLPGTAVDYDLRASIYDGNGIAHFFWTQSDDSNLRHRSFDIDASAFATLNLIGSTPLTTSNSAAYSVGAGTSYYRNNEWNIAIPVSDGSTIKVGRVKAADAATQSAWTNTTVVTATIETTNSNPCVLVADNEQGGKLFLIYTKTDGKLYYTHDQASDSWVAEQEIHAGTKTVAAISGGVLLDAIGITYLDTAPATDDLKFDSL